MTAFGVSLARVGRSAAGARIAAAGLAFHEKQARQLAVAAEAKGTPDATMMSPQPKASSCREIIRAVAKAHRLGADDVLSRSRLRTIGAARTEAMYRCVAETHHSLPAIGRIFGRDHTSVGAAVIRHHLKTGLPLPRGMKARSFGLARQRNRTNGVQGGEGD